MNNANENLMSPTKQLPAGQGYRLSDYFSACEQNKAPFEGRPSQQKLFAAGDGMIVRYDDRENHGSQEVVRIDTGFGMIASDFTLNEEHIGKSEGDDWFTLQFRSEGESEEVFGDIGQFHGQHSRCHVTILPSGLEHGSWVAPDTIWSTTLIALKLSALQKIFSESMDALPKGLRQIVDQSQFTKFFFNSLPMSQGMSRALNDLKASPFTGRMRRLYCEAKSLELICVALGDMKKIHDDTNSGMPLVLLPQDITRLYDARELLDANLASPLTQKKLGQLVGLNQTKLARGFREVFGLTIFEYFQQKRMNAAREMLQEQGVSVFQVSQDLGYAHPGSLTKAFRSYFGVTPKSYQ